MRGTRISTPSDFPHVAVYESIGAKERVYTVAFDNLEYIKSRQYLLAFAACAVLWFGGLFYLGDVADLAGALGLPALAGPAGVYVLMFYLLFRSSRPWKIRRAVELDFGHDRFTVLKGVKPVLRRQLTRMADLTVEDHPEAEIERRKREMSGAKGKSLPLHPKEEQHCLIGWFGARGAEQVVLLCRAEWPSRHSLLEVREAILWAIEQAMARQPAGQSVPEAAPKRRTQTQGGGLKPPLD